MCSAGVGGVTDLHRTGNVGDRSRVEIDMGHLQLRPHQLGRDGSMVRRHNTSVLHKGPRGLQERHESSIGFESNGFRQMKIEPRLCGTALVVLRSMPCDCDDVRSPWQSKALDSLCDGVAVLLRHRQV